METYRNPLEPLPFVPSLYGVSQPVAMRARDLPGMGSLLNSELFPNSTPVIYPGEAGLRAIREHTEAALAPVDLSRIKPSDSVNILASHHSFLLLGGEPYAEMVRTIKDLITERTGATDIRFVGGVGLRFRESEEQIKKFGLDEYFQGKAWGVAPIDKGVAIETSLGTLYGLRKVYDADWIIHTHNTDIREVHFHRMVDRIMKPFAMSYARYETRSVYHHNLGPRGANFVARAIFESEMVQNKIVCAVIMKAFPVGITGIDADSDLLSLSDRITAESLREYGKVVTLLGKIDECIAVLDCPGPVPYTFGGGLIFGNFLSANVDQFDLDIPLTPYSFFSESAFGRHGQNLVPDVPRLNPAIKAVVNNYSFKGYPSNFFAEHLPTIVVGQAMADLFRRCPQNTEYMDYAMTAHSLEAAMDYAYKVTGTKNVIIFDGAQKGINVSRPLIDMLRRTAPQVVHEVEQELLPKWLTQRGIAQKMA